MSMRRALAAYLEQVRDATPGLERVKVVESVRALGTLSQTTLIVKTDSYTPEPVAPLSKRRGNFTLTLVSRHQDIDDAEDDLDDTLEVLLPALLTHAVIWTEATQVGFGDSNLAYDIKVTSVLIPDAPDPEPTPEPVPDEGE